MILDVLQTVKDGSIPEERAALIGCTNWDITSKYQIQFRRSNIIFVVNQIGKE